MFDAIKSVSGDCAEKLRAVLSLSDSSIKLLRFVSDNVWGLADRQFVSMHIAWYLVQAWDVRHHHHVTNQAIASMPSTLGMCVILANILEQCSLFLPLQWGAGSMALMLWLDW
jgi:hypothetical protein